MSILNNKSKFSLLVLVFVVATSILVLPKGVFGAVFSQYNDNNTYSTTTLSGGYYYPLATSTPAPLYFTVSEEVTLSQISTYYSISAGKYLSFRVKEDTGNLLCDGVYAGSTLSLQSITSSSLELRTTNIATSTGSACNDIKLGVGSYYLLLYTNNPGAGYTISWKGGSLQAPFVELLGVGEESEMSVTRIISITPATGAVVSTSTDPLTFSTDVYIESGSDPITVTYEVNGLACAVDATNWFRSCGQSFSTTTTLAGYQSFTWTATSADFNHDNGSEAEVGRHISTVKISRPDSYLWLFPTTEQVTASSSSWVYGGLSGADLIVDEINTTINSNYASSTIKAGEVCNVLWGFNFSSCFSVLVLPDMAQIKSSADVALQIVGESFPFGYLTDFISIISTSSTSTLPLISATIPAGIAGSGASFRIELTPTMLDYIWYATTSQFINSSAPATSTLFVIVSYYWDKVVYILLLIYILGRLVGSHLFSSPYKNKEKSL